MISIIIPMYNMEECGTIEDNYQNRYPGFLSERLITYYFHRNVDEFRICYADESFFDIKIERAVKLSLFCMCGVYSFRCQLRLLYHS